MLPFWINNILSGIAESIVDLIFVRYFYRFVESFTDFDGTALDE